MRNTINEIVTHIVNYPDVFFIGRGMDYAFSLEGALKVKGDLLHPRGGLRSR